MKMILGPLLIFLLYGFLQHLRPPIPPRREAFPPEISQYISRGSSLVLVKLVIAELSMDMGRGGGSEY